MIQQIVFKTQCLVFKDKKEIQEKPAISYKVKNTTKITHSRFYHIISQIIPRVFYIAAFYVQYLTFAVVNLFCQRQMKHELKKAI